MAYSKADLDRRSQLGSELLSTHVRPTLMPELVDLRLSGPGRHLDIPFPAGSAPTPSTAAVTDPANALPKSDVVVLTYTSDEAKALADVMTPGRFSSDWKPLHPRFRRIPTGHPKRGRQHGRPAASGATGRRRSGPRRNSRDEVRAAHAPKQPHGERPSEPSDLEVLHPDRRRSRAVPHFFCIGTAGGTYTNRPLRYNQS